MAIARVPYLPGVVDTDDQTYTVLPTALLGFASSGVAHVCAATPAVKNLIRFCFNGFKLPTQASSSYAKDSKFDSSKRSYKSLQDNKGISQTIGSVPPRSKASSRDTIDHLQLSIKDAEDDGGFVELRPVEPAARDTSGSGRTAREERVE